MKVKVIDTYKPNYLEEEINKFLETIEPKRGGAESVVVDIKYSTVWCVNPQSSSYEDNSIVYTAMIMYK